jgi:hypothetical protein
MLASMRAWLETRIMRLARQIGLGLVAFMLLAAPLAISAHAAEHEASVSASQKDEGEFLSSPCNADHQHGDARTSAPGESDCCLPDCHAASSPSGPLPTLDTFAALSPRSVRLGLADGRVPDGLYLAPPIGPPRIDA